MILEDDKAIPAAPPRPPQPNIGSVIIQALKGLVAAGAAKAGAPKARLGSSWFRAKKCGGCGGQ